MKNNFVSYKDATLSNEDFATFLYFTDRESLEQILKWGVPSTPNVRGNLIFQPYDAKSESWNSQIADKRGDSIVVVRIPQKVWRNASLNLKDYELAHPRINADDTFLFINPNLIYATISRDSREVELNPRFDGGVGDER